MLPIFATFIPFALLFIYFIPTSRSRILGILYMFLLLFFVWGVGGFVFAGAPTANEFYVFYAFYIFLLGIHIPLILKFSQLSNKKDSLKSARKILDSDVRHLTDSELHYRLKH